MAKTKFDITYNFINQTVDMIAEFGAVRMDSLLRFIELSFGIGRNTALKVLSEMIDRGYINSSNYANSKIVKVDNRFSATYKYLDVFDAYLYLCAESKNHDSGKVIANSAVFPVDFTIYDSSGTLYYVFVYDAHLAQKLKVHERKVAEESNATTLIVFPIGTNIKNAEVPKINGSFRLAVTRISDGGSTVCQISKIQGEKSG